MQESLTVQQRVQNGINWLDEYGPADWRDRITLKEFNIASPCKCVLGLTYGKPDDMAATCKNGFFRGRVELEAHSEPFSSMYEDVASAYGFNCLSSGDIDYFEEDDTDADYDDLQVEWIKQLDLQPDKEKQ